LYTLGLKNGIHKLKKIREIKRGTEAENNYQSTFLIATKEEITNKHLRTCGEITKE